MKLSALGKRALGIAVLVALGSSGAGAAPPELLCVKDHRVPMTGNVIACYTDAGCKLVQSRGAEPVRDYDTKSVAAALGREKIEGIVTSSAAIQKKIRAYGYDCRKAGL